LPNNRVEDGIKANRGTLNKSRVIGEIVPDPKEPRPRRPVELTGPAADFWDKNWNALWAEGVVQRHHALTFSMVCRTYGELVDLEATCADLEEYYEHRTQFGLKIVRRPQFVVRDRLRKQFFTFADAFGLNSTAVKKLPKAKKRTPKGKPGDKPSILEFSNPNSRGDKK
jgi:hypothetical protein